MSEDESFVIDRSEMHSKIFLHQPAQGMDLNLLLQWGK